MAEVKQVQSAENCSVIKVGETVDKNISFEAYDPINDTIVTKSFEDLMGKFSIVFFYPADFTFVCPTELSHLAQMSGELARLDIEVIAVSTDNLYTHRAWQQKEALLKNFPYLMASDHNGAMSCYFGAYHFPSGMSMRSSVILGPNLVVKYKETIADEIGRSVYGLIRKVQALSFIHENPDLVAPADWLPGQPGVKPCLDVSGRMKDELGSLATPTDK